VPAVRFAAFGCAILWAGGAHAELVPKSRNTLLFVESAQKGHEWEAYRLAEDRRPVIFEVQGPGRVLLTLRTFAEGAEPAVSVALLDERIVLTAKVEPKVDESAKFPDEQKRVPSKVGLYLVRVPHGAHRVTVRYSSGGPTLVAGRFSETDTVEDLGEGEPALVVPRPREDVVPKIGTLRAADELEAEPLEERRKRREELDAQWREPIPDREQPLEPRVGPARRAVQDEVARAAGGGVRRAAVDPRPLMVEAPWLLFELRGGAQVDRLGLSVAPAFGLEGRIPIPGLDARSFTVGVAAEVAHTQGESAVEAAEGPIVGIAKVRHTAFTASADLRWVFLREQAVEPYLSLGGGALFGSMSSSIDEQRISGSTRGGFGLAVAGAALGGLGHRPYVEARLQAGLLSSKMIRSGESAHLAASLMIGFRFELLTEVEAAP
jgi:hypothetical protein